MQTRVCRLRSQKELRVETETVPELEAGQVLVQVGAGGICGSDLHYFLDGGFGPIRVREPIILGHEAAGNIVAVAPDVAGLAVGDLVALNPSQPCGTCKFCLAGDHQHCLTMRFRGSAMRFPHEQGLFRDYVVLAAGQCFRVDPARTVFDAALAEPFAVGLRAIGRAEQIAGQLAGKRVLVTGAGPIGALLAMAANHFGAAETVVTDIEDATLAVAAKVGASATFNVRNQPDALDPWAVDKGQFDIVFECSAAPAAIRTAIETVRPLGTVVQVGVTGDAPLPLNLLVSKEINLIGTHRFDSDFARAVDLINTGTLPLAPVVTHHIPLDRANDAFVLAADRSQAVKVHLTFG